MDVLVLQRFVSFPGLKNEAYTCVLSFFRRAFAPFHSFTLLVSTRGFKRAGLELGSGGLRVSRTSYVTCVPCLFRLVALRTSYACFVSWLLERVMPFA